MVWCVPFIGGVLFGTAGIKALSGKTAKKAYTQVVAAGLRAKDDIMTKVDEIKEEAGDILADAKALNEEYVKEDAPEVIEDTSEE